jgi:dipeptidyl aminopeptidase/acylaminoacyl peptidase
MPPIKFWLQRLSGVKPDEVRPIDYVKRIDCPTMIVHSEADTMIKVDHFYQYQAVTKSMANVETWLVQKRQHHRLWLDPEYLGRQLQFFRTHLGKPSTP